MKSKLSNFTEIWEIHYIFICTYSSMHIYLHMFFLSWYHTQVFQSKTICDLHTTVLLVCSTELSLQWRHNKWSTVLLLSHLILQNKSYGEISSKKTFWAWEWAKLTGKKQKFQKKSIWIVSKFCISQSFCPEGNDLSWRLWSKCSP